MECSTRLRDATPINPRGNDTQTTRDFSRTYRGGSTLEQKTTDTKSGVICLLEFKRMSDVTSHYIVRAKSVALAQYESLRSALGKVMQHSGWVVLQIF